MNKILDGKKVRFLASDKKYVKVPYPCIAPMSEKMSTYVTGQHIDPDDEKTWDNLTVEEMTGQEDISMKKRKMFGHIINPDRRVQIFHGKVMDCTLDDKGRPKNAKDYAEAYFILAQKWLVAPDKSSVRPSTHKFYLEDKEADSRKRVQISDRRYQAEKLLREKASIEDYKTIVYMLNMKLPGFYEEPEGMTSTTLMDLLLKQTQENPDQIIYYFSDEAEPFLLGAKLYASGIIEKKHDGYYYKSYFLGADSNKLMQYFLDEKNNEMTEKLRRDLHVDA